MVSGGFNFTIIKSFIPIFYEEASVLKEILQKKCELESDDCDISVPVSMATMEMIGKTAFGVTFNAQNGGHHRFVENLQTAMHVSNSNYKNRSTTLSYSNEIYYLFNFLDMGIQSNTSLVLE